MLMKRTLAICLTLVMLFSSLVFTGVTASAMAGGGLPTTVTYSFGCDLSTWNVDGASTLNHSLVDFDKMYADGCEFAILRIGFEGSSTGANTMDKAFLRYYEEARAAGMKLGVYFYALGTTYAEAVDDAEWVISVIEENNMYFEYPIYYDVEEDDQVALSRTNYTNLCLGWCETMEAAGYLPGVYATLTNINDKLTDDFKSKYETWGARVKTNSHTGSSANQYGPYDYTYYNNAGMWQYAFYDYEYDGIGLDMLDVNVCYKDYPAIMTEYGYNNCTPATDKTALKAAIDAAKAIKYTSYTETVLKSLRASYVTAVDVYYTVSATQSEIDTAASNLNGYLAQTGVNAGGVYITGLNKKIAAGDCNIFTSQLNYDSSTDTWQATVSNANIAYTLNVVCGWDDAQQSWVIESKSTGTGTSTPAITLSSNQILIAAHTDSSVAGSATNYNTLYAAKVGDAISFYGITLQGSLLANSSVSVGAYVRFEDGTSDNLLRGKDYTISGNGGTYGEYTADLTDGIASANINTMAGNWFAFKSDVATGTTTNTENALGSVTFDLGKEYDITEVKAHFANIYAAGVPTPSMISVSVSDDGVNFTEYGTYLSKVQGAKDEYTGEIVYWAELSGITGLSGRYVRLNVGVTGTWAFLNEVEVYGLAADGSSILSENADYTISGNGQTYGSYNANLTDGVASESWGDDMWAGDVWFAFKDDVEVGAETNTENGIGKVTIDLGDTYDISTARVHLGYNNGLGVPRPAAMTLWISDDGINFTQYSESFPVIEAPTDTGYSYWCELTEISGLVGRYAQIQIDVNGTWAFLNEVEIYGSVYTASEEPEVHAHTPGAAATCTEDQVCTECGEVIVEATGHTAGDWTVETEATTSSVGTKVQKCTECGETLATETIPMLYVRGDVNGDGQIKATDYLILKRILIGASTFEALDYPETAEARSDVNNNGTVNSTDYLVLKRYLLGVYTIEQ